MGSFVKNVKWMGVFGLAGILSFSAPGRALADDGGAKDSAVKNAAAGSAKTDSGGSAKAEKKVDAPAALSERERVLLDRVEQLERRVEELEAKGAAPKKAEETGEAVPVAKSDPSVTANVARTSTSIAANQSAKSATSVDLADLGRSNAAPVHDLAGGASEANGSNSAESTSVAAAKSSSVAADPSLDAAVAIGTQVPATPKKAEPFAFADWTWLNGNARTKDSPMDTKFFTPEIRADIDYVYDFNHPKDDTIGGSSEVFRSDEVQVTQLGVGGDFHYDNVRARVMTQFGLYSQTTPRNDASGSRGQWNLDNAYRYLSEAYGGYHFNCDARGQRRRRHFHVVHRPVQLLQLRQLGVPAFVCFFEHALVFQWRPCADFSDGEVEDRAVVHQRVAIVWPIQRPAWIWFSDSVASEWDGCRCWGTSICLVKTR